MVTRWAVSAFGWKRRRESDDNSQVSDFRCLESIDENRGGLASAYGTANGQSISTVIRRVELMAISK